MLNSAVRLRLNNSQSNAVRETNTDVNKLVVSPMTRVAANPFTAGVPKKNRKAHETTVVTWVSTRVAKAFENPAAYNIPRNELIKETLDWLDRYLGPVK